MAFQAHTQQPFGFLLLGSLSLLAHQEAQRERALVFSFPLKLLRRSGTEQNNGNKEAFSPIGQPCRLFFFLPSYVKIHILYHCWVQRVFGALISSAKQTLALDS